MFAKEARFLHTITTPWPCDSVAITGNGALVYNYYIRNFSSAAGSSPIRTNSLGNIDNDGPTEAICSHANEIFLVGRDKPLTLFGSPTSFGSTHLSLLNYTYTPRNGSITPGTLHNTIKIGKVESTRSFCCKVAVNDELIATIKSYEQRAASIRLFDAKTGVEINQGIIRHGGIDVPSVASVTILEDKILMLIEGRGCIIQTRHLVANVGPIMEPFAIIEDVSAIASHKGYVYLAAPNSIYVYSAKGERKSVLDLPDLTGKIYDICITDSGQIAIATSYGIKVFQLRYET